MSRITGPVLVAIVLHLELVALYVWREGGNPAVLVGASNKRAGHYPFEAIRDPKIQQGYGPFGYDGQFYYALSRAPLARQTEEVVDLPAVRHARILYPILCWLCSGGGDPDALFWAMPLVNLLAIGGLAALGALAASKKELTPWWGVMLPLAVNAILPSLRDLTDVLSIFAVCGLLCAWLWRWPDWSLGLWATAALFSREQNVLVVLGVLAVALGKRRWAGALALGLALTAFAAWIVALRALYGAWPLLPAGENVSPRFYGLPIPFWGLLWRWSQAYVPGFGLTHVLGALIITMQILLVVYMLVSGSDPVLVLTALTGAALALSAGRWIYADPWSYPRIFAWMPLALWLAAVQARKPWLLVLLGLPVVLPLYQTWTFL